MISVGQIRKLQKEHYDLSNNEMTFFVIEEIQKDYFSFFKIMFQNNSVTTLTEEFLEENSVLISESKAEF